MMQQRLKHSLKMSETSLFVAGQVAFDTLGKCRIHPGKFWRQLVNEISQIAIPETERSRRT